MTRMRTEWLTDFSSIQNSRMTTAQMAAAVVNREPMSERMALMHKQQIVVSPMMTMIEIDFGPMV
jgi:hypothetical protein